MAATASFSNTITSEVIANSVLSYTGSKIFIQKLIPTTVGLILHHRTNIDRSNFEEHNFRGLSFTTFKRVLSNKVLKEVCRWCKGALEAFKKEYLRELYLIFIDISNHFEVLESYKFQFEYGNSQKGEIKVTNDILKAAMGELFRAISGINVEPLKESQFIPYICITYNNNVPRDYEPPYFIKSINKNDSAARLATLCKDYISFGKITTGFHSMSCECNIPGWEPCSSKCIVSIDLTEDASIREVNNTEPSEIYQHETFDCTVLSHQNQLDVFENDNIIVSSIDISDNEGQLDQEVNEVLHDSIVIEDSITIYESQGSQNSSRSVFDKKINCACSLKKKFYNIDLVECSRCHLMQHVPCLGHLYVDDVCSMHVCDRCKNNKITFSRHLLSCLRLIVAHTFFNSSFAIEVLNEMKSNTKTLLIKILQVHKAITYVGNKYVVAKDMDVFIEKVFPEKGKINGFEDIGIKPKRAKFS